MSTTAVDVKTQPKQADNQVPKTKIVPGQEPTRAFAVKPPVKKEDTQVTQWLQANDAGDFAEQFYEGGFYYIKDVTDDDIRKLIPAEKPGLRNALMRLVKAESSKPVPDIPPLPPGATFDLSLQKLTAPGDVTFSIPTELQVSADGKEVFAPTSLTPEQWIVVARNSCMLYGRRMDGSRPATASYPVLHWKVPTTTAFVRSEHLAAEVKSELTYTEGCGNYVRQGFSKISASVSVPYCSASVEREANEKSASAQYEKQLFMTGIWHYPRAHVLLAECTVVAPEFVSAIRAALQGDPDQPAWRTAMGLDEKEPTADQQAAAKQAIARVERELLKYGHVIGREVEVGGRLFFVRSERMSGSVQSHEQTQKIAAAVSAKVSVAEVGAGAAGGEGSDEAKQAHNLAQSVSFTALGGDTTLASNPQAWAGTVKDPNLWTIIGIEEAKPTIDLLPAELRAPVVELWKKYHRRGVLDGQTFRLCAASRPHMLLSTSNAPTDTADEKDWKCVLARDLVRYGTDDRSRWTFASFHEEIYSIRSDFAAREDGDRGRLVAPAYGLWGTYTPQSTVDVNLGAVAWHPSALDVLKTKLANLETFPEMWHVYPYVDPDASGEGSNIYFLEHLASGKFLTTEIKLVDKSVGKVNPECLWKLEPADDLSD